MDGWEGGNEVVEIRMEGRKGEPKPTLVSTPKSAAGIPGETH